jgi:hypothetical protein
VITCDHERAKRDSDVWALLPKIGEQRIPAFGDEPAEVLELRNCPVCHSTLAKTIKGA